MRIGGFQKFSLIDYPGKICAIIFTQGCNFRCPYCHNPELVLPEKFTELIPEEQVFSFLESRRGKLEAVEFTGGEPTLQPDLIDVIQKIKKMGFLVKLDSNGSNPDILQKIADLDIVDYFATDIKAPLEKYQEITRSDIGSEKIAQSIKIIMNSGKAYEFRTTVVKPLLVKEDFDKIGKLIQGAEFYAFQKFENKKVLSPSLFLTEHSLEELQEFCATMKKYVQKCVVR